MAEQVVTYELDGNVARIGLDRPAKRNALSSDLRTQLNEAVARSTRPTRVTWPSRIERNFKIVNGRRR